MDIFGSFLAVASLRYLQLSTQLLSWEGTGRGERGEGTSKMEEGGQYVLHYTHLNTHTCTSPTGTCTYPQTTLTLPH